MHRDAIEALIKERTAAVLTPAADADRQKRAAVIVDGFSEYDLRKLSMLFSMKDEAFISEPLRGDNWGQRLMGDKLRAAHVEAHRRFRAMAVKQVAAQLRIGDVRSVYQDPVIEEAQRIWLTYCDGVGAIARGKGNKEPDFVRRWRDLIDQRRDAEQFDDDDAADTVRSIDARLLRLVGIPYPDAAKPPSSANGAGKTRRHLSTRPLALENTLS